MYGGFSLRIAHRFPPHGGTSYPSMSGIWGLYSSEVEYKPHNPSYMSRLHSVIGLRLCMYSIHDTCASGASPLGLTNAFRHGAL
jgi:hypothetical protein